MSTIDVWANHNGFVDSEHRATAAKVSKGLGLQFIHAFVNELAVIVCHQYTTWMLSP